MREMPWDGSQSGKRLEAQKEAKCWTQLICIQKETKVPKEEEEGFEIDFEKTLYFNSYKWHTAVCVLGSTCDRGFFSQTTTREGSLMKRKWN